MYDNIYKKLKEVARAKCLITYSEIGREVGLKANDPQLWQILYEIDKQEYQAGRPMLAALVVHQKDRLPGKGFFTLALELGVYQGQNNSAFWGYELCKVHSYWSSPSSIQEVSF